MFTHNLRELHLTRKMLSSQNNADNTYQPNSQFVVFAQVILPRKLSRLLRTRYRALNQEGTFTSGHIENPPFLRQCLWVFLLIFFQK